MRYIDSHTEGEPTRVVISGGPDLGGGTLKQQLAVFARDFDDVRRALILEPRGSAALVGALLCPPTDPECEAGVIFFNNAGFLGMCGHGSIGVAVTLAYLGRARAPQIKLETPVGVVTLQMNGANEATLENVPSFVHLADVTVAIDGYPPLRGDVGWGGNWFFLVDWTHTPIRPECIPQLTQVTRQIRRALRERGITGANGAEIDHIELFCSAADTGSDSRNFVLCPGDEYDRSPCGTGTSAKLACLAAHGQLKPGEVWTQESVIGGRFQASYRLDAEGRVVPAIRGRAYICAEGTLVRKPEDPFRNGIPAP
ncbi:proline racemase family protein [Peristeroidobacter soli]|uniref:proline racemase family protein n=1 Tax=Peristeroidobacter soli TaxID=2497877 RepID=UPI00101D4101|nr:proline racemase family protein [Peristeroidobacter soli]